MVASSPRQAVENGHNVGSYETGMCQKFVRDQCWRVPSLYGSAIEAWNGARYKHPGDRTPPVGAPCYYRGGSYGHAVIYCGPDHKGIRSTDCDTAYEVSDASLDWPERAWGYAYLGWTEDINGVRVITPAEEDDMPLTDDDLSAIANRVNKVLGDYDSKGKPRGDGEEYANQRLTQIENVVRDIQARVKKLE
jgi:hypothetical protein